MKYFPWSGWVLLLLLFGFTHTEQDPVGTTKLARELTPLADFTVMWEDCGEINAYYWTSTHKITLCNELRGKILDGVIRFFLAHEIGHAVIIQRDIPFVGNEETAADEFAAWYLTISGRENDVLQAGEFWLERANVYPPHISYPDDERRGWALTCYAKVELEQTWDCPRSWGDITRTWFRLLKLREM